MTNTNRPTLLTLGVYLNALILGLVVVVMWVRNVPSNIAMAQPAAGLPIAGGGGLFLMPAQFAQNRYGLYIMDVDARTIASYEWEAGEKLLRLTAVRDFNFDRQLRQYNTFPLPSEVEKLVQIEREKIRDDVPPEKKPVAP